MCIRDRNKLIRFVWKFLIDLQFKIDREIEMEMNKQFDDKNETQELNIKNHDKKMDNFSFVSTES